MTILMKPKEFRGLEGLQIKKVEATRPEHSHPHDHPWEMTLTLSDGSSLKVKAYLSPALCSRPPTLKLSRTGVDLRIRPNVPPPPCIPAAG